MSLLALKLTIVYFSFAFTGKLWIAKQTKIKSSCARSEVM